MKKILNYITILLAVTGLTSCLDEDPIFNPDDSTNIIEIKSGGGAIQSPVTAPNPVYINTFVSDLQEAIVPVTISYSGAGTAPKDITVNIAIDPEVLGSYNAWYNESEDPKNEEEDHDRYIMLPEAVYEIPTTTVTIPAGQREVILNVKVNPSLLDFDNEYALPFKIVESNYGVVSGNFNTAVVAVGLKNPWDGVYTNTYSGSLGSGTNEIELVTTGPYSVKMIPGLIGVYSNEWFMNVDPNTNKVTIEMNTLLPVATDPSSYYDPETKTFYLKWTSNGGGRTFEQTLVRKAD
ncbi:DUF1735 domain-containing protein [Pontibacter kalidii]|uniref:DUF1735 domain-containing protein n=1 Tax=Pontibacter kalidii TaxID=2592049 RepID=UPI002253F53B|nr:DUF1735 domain-containing protein [Pontibacter kalidii]